MIVIVDSGGANLASISNAIVRLGKKVTVSGAMKDIDQASHIILPGVGSAETVMTRLNTLGLVDALKATTKPVLGICVGMQILFEFSEEETTTCLGILKGTVKKLSSAANCRLPHMGWNTIKICASSVLMQGIPQEAYVYYVHNFAVPVSGNTIAETEYGFSFSAAVQHRNFMGVQFHPERSGTTGSQLLKNFLEQAV
ncbi:imidazole glycerol phosphate synthase subunit HisH [Legionella fairfieldensis]|uniref:imidazole glycerol phosphate synthase subunit HisH n=1 Tax=Legionella fairfieldensis TaxID=45064 RepID=UPI0004902D63|nr:imidazole glycerol phosphate synthase subunit HisH [Legionella fairfieldensis]